MQEIERVLNDNIGNKITRELVIGLTAIIGHHVKIKLDEAFAEGCRHALNEPDGGKNQDAK